MSDRDRMLAALQQVQITCHHWLPIHSESASRQIVADALTGWRPPAQVITTVEELAELPISTIVRDAQGSVAERSVDWRGNLGWMILGDDEHYVWGEWLWFEAPATVLWEPEETA